MDDAIEYLTAMKAATEEAVVTLNEQIQVAQTAADALPGLMNNWQELYNRIQGYDTAITALQNYVPEPAEPEE